jgi:hypothetical protein
MRKLLILVLVLLVGCGSNTDIIAQDFHVGTAGLEIILVENAPPKEIYQNSDFPLVLQVVNQAAYPITNGAITILGIDSTYFEIEPGSVFFDQLEGKTLPSPEGDIIFFDFDGHANVLRQKAERNDQNYFIKAQFDSTMKFSDTICINTDLYKIHDGGCQTESSKSFGGQGAPLTISKMEQITSPGSNTRVEFRFTLANKGNGKLLKTALTQSKLGNEEMVCIFQGSPFGELTKVFDPEKQEVVLVCTIPLLEKSSFQTTLVLDFDYSYEVTKQERLTLIQ